ncbi:Phospholipid N-methyltransferase [Pantoea agglomerans]|uniref:Phospholipid N-methyltransferase n=1 Tax=Enterobacter agglomerans TaxID=549 RepID=A0A379AHD9_ENTAG|nr:Phospholipid N-methyltransferase [Pantoea agglomerans]
MTVRTCSAEYLSGEYDVIFSGLPLLSLPTELREAILRAVYNALGPNGVFVQFQYTSLTQPDLSRYFTWERQRVMKNVPPAWGLSLHASLRTLSLRHCRARLLPERHQQLTCPVFPLHLVCPIFCTAFGHTNVHDVP